MQDVHVRQPPANPFQPLKEIACLEHRGIERLAVEADERARGPQLAGDRFEQGRLVRVPGEDELSRDKHAPRLEPRAADQKRVRPGAATEAGRLEIEEDERRARRRPSSEQRRPCRRPLDTLGQPAHLLASVPRRRFPSTFDDETGAAILDDATRHRARTRSGPSTGSAPVEPLDGRGSTVGSLDWDGTSGLVAPTMPRIRSLRTLMQARRRLSLQSRRREARSMGRAIDRESEVPQPSPALRYYQPGPRIPDSHSRRCSPRSAAAYPPAARRASGYSGSLKPMPPG